MHNGQWLIKWFDAIYNFCYFNNMIIRAGASTRFTSTSTSTCNMCEYEYLIITWVRVRVLVDEYKYEYRSMINILYRQQIFVVRSLDKRVLRFLKFWDKAPTAHCPCKLSLSIYICLIILCNLIQWHFNLHFATYWLSWLTLTTCTMTFELTSTSTVRVPEIQYSSTASTSTPALMIIQGCI